MKHLCFTLFILFSALTSFAVGPITGSSTVCAGSTITLSDATAGGTWSSSNATIADVGSATGIVTGMMAGVATISYTDGIGTATKTITVNPLPIAYTVTGGGTFCAGDTGVHVGLSNSQVGVNYYLYVGSGVSGPYLGIGAPLDFGLQTASGIYTVVAINTSTLCSDFMTGGVTVTATPIVVPSVSIAISPNDTVCSGTSVTFTATPVNGGSGPAYEWDVNGFNVGVTTAAYTYVPANGDIISVKLTSDEMCVSPDTAFDTTVSMTVLNYQVPTVSIDPTPGDTICMGSAIIYMPLTSFAGTAPTYTWTVNGAVMSSGPSFTYIPSDGDQVFATMTSNYLCLSTNPVLSSTHVISVDTPIVPIFYVDAYPGDVVAPGTYVTFVAIVTNDAHDLSYQWIINNTVVPGALSDTFITNSFDTGLHDSITCVITTNDVCRLSSYTWAYITKSTAGVAGMNMHDGFTLFPNPAKGSLNLRGTFASGSNETYTITITDMLGREVYNKQTTATLGKVNEQVLLDDIANGSYLLSVRSADDTKVFHIVVAQ